ncbi:hypothetical protein D3C76_1656250 [compost metagenome]
MHDVFHPGLFRAIEKRLALAQHVHGVASDQKGPVDAFQGRGQRLFSIKIQHDRANTPGCKSLGFGG